MENLYFWKYINFISTPTKNIIALLERNNYFTRITIPLQDLVQHTRHTIRVRLFGGEIG